jgi:hypothetical protein
MRLSSFSGGEFIDFVTEKLSKFRLRVKRTQLHFSAKERSDMFYFFNIFKQKNIPRKVVLKIQDVDFGTLSLNEYEEKCLQSFKKLPQKNISLKELVDASGGLSRTKVRIKLAEKYLKEVTVKDSYFYIKNIDEEESDLNVLSFISGISNGLELISIFIKRNRYRRQSTSHDFCVLCWRIVRHHEYKESDDEFEDRIKVESRHYCPVHHPTRSKNNYMRAVRSLIRAVESERPELNSEIEKLNSKSLSISKKCSILNRFTKSFAEKMYPFDCEGYNWNDFEYVFMTDVAIRYKFLFSKIKHSTKKRSSWEDWFFNGVLDKIDTSPDKNELAMWKTLDKEYKDFGWGISTFNNNSMKFVMSIFRRYEAYCYVKNRPVAKRGRKKNIIKNETELQKKIKLIILDYISEGRKLCGKDIAHKAGVSQKTVSLVKNSMDL